MLSETRRDIFIQGILDDALGLLFTGERNLLADLGEAGACVRSERAGIATGSSVECNGGPEGHKSGGRLGCIV